MGKQAKLKKQRKAEGFSKKQPELHLGFKKFPRDRYVIYIPEIEAFWGFDGKGVVDHPGEARRFYTEAEATSAALHLLWIMATDYPRKEGYLVKVCYLEDCGEKIGVTAINEYFTYGSA